MSFASKHIPYKRSVTEVLAPHCAYDLLTPWRASELVDGVHHPILLSEGPTGVRPCVEDGAQAGRRLNPVVGGGWSSILHTNE
jgi:hypothetical protein